MKRKEHWLIWPALAVLVTDQISKWAVLEGLRMYESVTVIEGLFNLTRIQNRGMAFGLMRHSREPWGFYFLILATLTAVGVLLYWFSRLEKKEAGLGSGLGLILGGAIGNLLDRVRLGSVVDFLDFHVGALHWPAFNIADSAITLGTVWVALLMLFKDKSRS